MEDDYGIGEETGDVTSKLSEKYRGRKKERSKIRTKFVLESLREEMIELQEENARLRDIVRAKIPSEHADAIFDSLVPPPQEDDGTADGSNDDCLAELTKTLAIEDEDD